MGGESTHSRKFYVETRRRHTSTSWSVKNSNEALSKLEVGSIHASVQSANSELRNLERKLKAAKKKIQTLTEAHKSVTAFIAAERALLSPIRALPRELLARIFVLRSSISNTHLDYITAALTVSQVCRGWRALAHATAVLWVRFPLYYLDDWGKRIPVHQWVLYKSWLARCGSLTCDVLLRKAPPATVERAKQDDWPDDGHVVLNATHYSYRRLPRTQWSLLDMEYQPNNSYSAEVEDIASVRSLTIHIVDAKKFKRRQSVVERGPKLEELVLRCDPDSLISRPALLPLVPLENVKRCEMSSFPLTNGLQVLSEAEQLETLKWTVSHCEGGETVPHISTKVHTLDLTVWECLGEDGLAPLFDNLTAPQLATLKILWRYHPVYVDMDAAPIWESDRFITFLTRSVASLTSLTLLHANISEEELITLLEHTPLLKQFGLSDRYLREDDGWGVQMLGARLLHRLLPPSPGDLEHTLPLVPKLTTLKLRGGFEGNDMSDTNIMRVFEARYPLTSLEQTEYARLEVGAFHLLRPADHQLGGRISLAERASRLCARGLDFEFTAEAEVDSEDETGSESEGSTSF
ncbi:hypothetical protein B0H16DRAFT_1693399 [Mycena metata]|uniref:F-box domain-containing protein n=1 Tax=Mycena metata TaxID=1033252 RepID=A0AAD7N4C6_9AGAR|nr:hypothetical protein B0H16DRAFT_1693399 [Mycena metata]